ncbi:filamentous hemagglutinin family protein, partial [Rhodoplanes tepidamans]|nr:filamentous hemagglutinin family protein [Rhodoplanes tepidamans]
MAGGSATIGTPSNGTLTINQSTDRAIINWDSFSVGAGGTVNFNQPGASSATLNRVTGATPSSIYGTINAPGTVLLVNPNGIAIGSTGVVNVGSFAASTLDIKDSDFMSGSYTFTGNGASAAVTNAGRINVSDGGFAALLGGRVANDGVITARLGRVGLASGEMVTLDLAGDGFLSVAVPTSALDKIVDGQGTALVSNKGKIVADGGIVHLSAATAAGILRDAVNVPGSIRANSVGTSNGRIIIGGGAGGRVRISGSVRANGRNGASGGSVAVSGADVTVSGKISAKGATGGTVKLTATETLAVSGSVTATGTTGKGGTVTATASQVTIADTARIDVSGATGGTLLIGGDYQGGVDAANNFSAETVATATITTVEAGAQLIADGTAGEGGRIVVWSEDTTTFAGTISATGTTTGGFAEVSGHRLLDFTGTADLTGPDGYGTLLLDPRNIVISSGTGTGGTLSGGTYTPSADDSILNVSTLTTALASGNVVVTTGSSGSQSGNITVASAVSWTSGSTLTLTAANTIAINAAITATSGGLIINATNTVSATAAVDVASFTLQKGAWTQIATTLPTFSATSFSIASGASFLRALSGDGSSATPYLIADVYGLQGIGSSATLLSKSYALANDIDASGTAAWNSGAGFAPIGTTTTQFSGTFDGQGHVITGLTIYRPSSTYVGLFGDTLNATITNVGLVGGSITGGNYVGSLVGRLWSGTTASVTRSYADDVAVTGAYAGGLIGMVQSQTGAGATVSEAYASGAVTVTSSAASGGGLIGYVSATGTGTATITKTYAIGSVSGSGSTVGGLVGSLSGSGATVSQSWASGALTGGYKGGIVGLDYGGAVTTSYWDKTTTGVTSGAGVNVGGTVSATGLTSAQARTQSSYVGWDFTSTWTTLDGSTRPLLQMEASTTIHTAHQLQLVGMNATTLAASYTLATDIDLGAALADASDVWGSAGFVPIGSSTTQFTGSFDGLGHTVSGLTIDRSSADQVGLFGSAGSSAAISHLTLADVDITGHLNVGGLIGQNFGTVTAVSVSGSVVGSLYNVGGLVGQQSGGSISEAQSSATVEGYIQVGGLVGGLVLGGTISRSNATGSVKGGSSGTGNAGGLVGVAANGASISDSYSTASVSAVNAGGLIGTTNGAVTLTNVWSSGRVSALLLSGGLIYQQLGSAPVLSGVYWDATTTGVANACGSGTCSGATALTTAQALTQSSYSGFDFTNTWFMIDGSTRPFLRSEYSTTITNAHQLQLIAMNATTLGATYTLAADIDLGTALANPSEMWGSAGFVPIGSASAQFKGSLDGNGHVIDGLSIDRPTQDYVGLFGYIGNPGSVVSDLGLTNATVVGGSYVGILAGLANGTIGDVWSTGTVGGSESVGGVIGYSMANVSDSHSSATVSGVSGAGGLIGRLASSHTVSGSYATGTVTGDDDVGGLLGELAGSLTTSYATGAVTGIARVGGLVGAGTAGATITNAYASGAVTASLYSAGGLAGEFDGSSVSNAYATGLVVGNSSMSGGLIGVLVNGSVTGSYWDTQTTGQSSSAGGTGVTTATLQAALPSGWDTSVWGIVAGVSYPYLKSFWSGTPQVVSGTAYTNNGVTAASGGNVAVMVNGTAVGSTNAGANGYYYVLLAPGTIGSNSQLVSFTSGTNAGVSYVQNAAGSITSLNILGNTLLEQSAASTLSSISSGLAVAIGSSGVSTELANRWIIATGSSFSIDQAISQTGNLVLSSNGTVTQTAGASISAATLKLQYISGGISYFLTDSGNAISSLQAGNLGSGSLDLYSSTDLTVASFTANGGLLVRTAGALTVNGTLSSTATGDAVVLVAGTRFVNNAGASAISATNGRWVVYSASPSADTFGGLDSGNTAVWGATYAANAPSTIASGNRYVFAYQPTLTFTSTDATKTYGTTLDLSGNYAVSGYQAGVAGAYLADTAATAYSGTPTVTSTGTATDASVAGGPYVIDVSQGTVTSLNGYALSFVDAGTLTVDRAVLTIATAGTVAGSKVYDGTTAAAVTSDGTLAGLVDGDTVALTLGGTAYADKTVGTAKTVTGTYTISGADAGNYVLASTSFTGTADITAASLTIATAGTVAGSKVYDGTTAAAVTGNGTLAGLVDGDTVALTLGGTAYADKTVGTAKTVTGTYTISGADAGNYVLASTSFTDTADITAATLTIATAGTVAGSKVYDGNTAATVTGNGTLAGLVDGDTVALTLGGTAYADKTVGTGKTVTGTYAISGADAGNYVLASTSFTGTADITAATLTLATAGTVAGSKVYDGTTAATVTGNGTLAGLVDGDTVTVSLGGTTYADKTVGTGKTVTGTYALSGADAGNYVLASTSFTGTADITAATLTLATTGTVAGSKVYDGTTAATVTGNGTLAGLVDGDTVTVSLGGTTYADKTVGTGKTVTGTYALSGADAGNYVLAST